jgi:hypothetical protein
MVVARWNGSLDLERARRVLDGEAVDQEPPQLSRAI